MVPAITTQLRRYHADTSYPGQTGKNAPGWYGPSIKRTMAALAKTDLLILDDYGLAVLSKDQRHDLLEILEDRNGLRSILMISQLSVEH